MKRPAFLVLFSFALLLGTVAFSSFIGKEEAESDSKAQREMLVNGERDIDGGATLLPSEPIDVANALKEVDFHVKLPEDIPFEVARHFAKVYDEPYGEEYGKEFFVFYADKQSRQYMTMSVTEIDWKLGSDFELIKLPNGTYGGYRNNGLNQQLVWEDEEVSTILTIGVHGEGEIPVYTAEELVLLAKESWFD